MTAVIFQVRIGHQSVQILQTRGVLHQNDLVIGFQFQRVGSAAHSGVQRIHGADALIRQLVDHLLIDHCKHLGIVRCTVVIELTQFEIRGQSVQLMLVQFRIDVTGHSHGIQIAIGKRDTLILRRLADKADIKSRIMGNQHPISHKRKKLGKDFLNGPLVFHHFVGDAGKADNLLRYRYTGIDKRIIYLQHLSAFGTDGTDLRDLTSLGRQTGGFDIEHHHFFLQIVHTLTEHGTGGIVYKVCLYTVEHLHTQLFRFFHGRWECL